MTTNRKRKPTTSHTAGEHIPASKRQRDTVEEKKAGQELRWIPLPTKHVEQKAEHPSLPPLTAPLDKKNNSDIFDKLQIPNVTYKKNTNRLLSLPLMSDGSLFIGNVELLERRLGGRQFGLYTKRRIANHVLIGEYLGERISAEECAKLPDEERHYAISVPGDNDAEPEYYINAFRLRNECAFANTGEVPNAELRVENKKVFIYSICPILKGEAIIVNYGSFFPLQNKIPLQAHHGQLDSQQVFEKLKANYQYSAHSNAPLKKIIVKLLGENTQGNTAFIPQAMHLLTMQSAGGDDNMADEETTDTAMENVDVNAPVFTGTLDEDGGAPKISAEQIELNALMVACHLNDLDGVKRLIKLGSDVGRFTLDWRSPLRIVLGNNHSEQRKLPLIKYLLSRNADPEFCDDKNESAFHDCIRLNLNDCLKELCSNMDSEAQFKAHPLILAIEDSNITAVNLLLDRSNMADIKELLFTESKHGNALTPLGDQLKLLVRESSANDQRMTHYFLNRMDDGVNFKLIFPKNMLAQAIVEKDLLSIVKFLYSLPAQQIRDVLIEQRGDTPKEGYKLTSDGEKFKELFSDAPPELIRSAKLNLARTQKFPIHVIFPPPGPTFFNRSEPSKTTAVKESSVKKASGSKPEKTKSSVKKSAPAKKERAEETVVDLTPERRKRGNNINYSLFAVMGKNLNDNNHSFTGPSPMSLDS